MKRKIYSASKTYVGVLAWKGDARFQITTDNSLDKLLMKIIHLIKEVGVDLSDEIGLYIFSTFIPKDAILSEPSEFMKTFTKWYFAMPFIEDTINDAFRTEKINININSESKIFDPDEETLAEVLLNEQQ